MAYSNWNKKLMIQQLKYLKSNPKNMMTDRIRSDIINLQSLIDTEFDEITVFDSMATLTEQFQDDAETLYWFGEFLPAIDEFAENNSVLQPIGVGSVFGVGDLTPSLLFEFMREFFYQFDEEFGKHFDEVIALKKHNLRFSNNRSITYTIPTLNYSYINIQKEDTLDDFINAVHEYTHAIVDRICYRSSSLTYPFTELASLLLELIAADYMMEVYENMEEDLNTLRLNECKSLVVYAENISIEAKYLVQPTTKLDDDWKKVVADIQSISGKSKRYTKALLEKTAFEKFSYTLPYITAIELYYIYQQDKKACVDILKYLMYVERQRNYNEALRSHGVILNTHSADWVDTLIKRKKGF